MRDARNAGALLALSVALLAYVWVGFLSSDDWGYLLGSLGWLNDFPYVGTDHWQVRHPLVLPTALGFALFGVSEFTLALPAALYYCAFVVLTYFFVARYVERATAFLAAALVALMPLFPLMSSTALPDVTEAFFALASLWLFYRATEAKRPHWLLFAAGIVIGLAFWTRESAAALVLFYGILYLGGFGIARRYYWYMAAGTALMVGLELLYFAIMTGDPLHRYLTAAALGVRERDEGVAAFGFNHGGNLVVHWALDPLLLFLANQEFGILFYVAAPATVWACFSRALAPAQRRFARLVAGLGFTWLVFVFASPMFLNARYFAVTAFAGAIMIALWAVHSWARGPWARIVVATVVTANLAGLYLDTGNPRFAERALLAFLTANPHETVHTDPLTLRRIKKFALVHDRIDLAGNVTSDPVEANGVLAVIPGNVSPGGMDGMNFDVRSFKPGRDWPEIWRSEPRRRWMGIVLERLGLDTVLPPAIYKRFDLPHSPVYAYRAPPSHPRAMGATFRPEAGTPEAGETP